MSKNHLCSEAATAMLAAQQRLQALLSRVRRRNPTADELAECSAILSAELSQAQLIRLADEAMAGLELEPVRMTTLALNACATFATVWLSVLAGTSLEAKPYPYYDPHRTIRDLCESAIDELADQFTPLPLPRPPCERYSVAIGSLCGECYGRYNCYGSWN